MTYLAGADDALVVADTDVSLVERMDPADDVFVPLLCTHGIRHARDVEFHQLRADSLRLAIYSTATGQWRRRVTRLVSEWMSG